MGGVLVGAGLCSVAAPRGIIRSTSSEGGLTFSGGGWLGVLLVPG